MRVLIDGLIAPGDPRGVGRYVRGLARALARRDDIEVLVAHGAWHSPFFDELGEAGVSLVPVQLRFAGRPWRHAWHALRLGPLARARGADVIHVPDRFPVIRTRGVPVVTTIHDIAEVDQPDAFGLVQRRYRRVVLALQLLQSRRIVSPSRFTLRRLREHAARAGARSLAVPNGAGVEPTEAPERPADTPDGRFFLTVGALQRHKNVPQVIRAFHELAESDVSLVIAGPSHNDARATAVASASDARIVRLPAPTDGGLAWLYANAVALVFPSSYEGFGLPILEAMGFGCPVVTTGAGAMQEVAGGVALLIDPPNVVAIRSAMRRLLDDHELRERLSTQGRERAATFSWDRCARGTLAAYAAAIGAGIGPGSRGNPETRQPTDNPDR